MDSKQLNVLLADDDDDDCIFFSAAIEEIKESTNLTIVHGGEQLMDLLANDTGVLPDVLFLDLNMPRKNGFECLLEIKWSVTLTTLPVIIFSTSFELDVVNLLYKSGAQYFIRKPAGFHPFKNVIQQSLSLIRQGNVTQPEREGFVLTANQSQFM